LQLATRNWRAKPGRSIASISAIALGVGTVVSITCFYESVRQAVTDQVVNNWLGNSHLNIDPPLGHWGSVDQALAEPLARIEGVARVTYRLKRAMTAFIGPPEAAEQVAGVDAIGIDPATEYEFRRYRVVAGRLLEPGERTAAVIEEKSARQWGVAVDDTIRVAISASAEPMVFTVVGTYDVRRVAEFQRPTVLLPLPDLQKLKHEVGQVTSIDVMLRDPTVENLRRVGEQVRALVADWNRVGGTNWQVSTAETKLQQLREADKVTQLVLTLVAFVALLTSFFIILSTMSMGIVERIAVLGMMRCVGLTRGQLAVLVLSEVVPMGVLGVLAGWPIGLGLTQIGALLVPKYVEGVTISVWGTGLAIIGGLATTLAAAVILVVQVARVSPLEAANPEARPHSRWLVAALAVLGLAMLAVHQWMIGAVQAREWFRPLVAFCGVSTIYIGYVLLAPALVLLAGTAFVNVVAVLLRVRRKLARDQIGRSPWRSTAVCWMLMVGLSLIVYIEVRSESFIAAWDFPSRLPATFVWSPDRVRYPVLEEVRKVPGVVNATAVGELGCKTGPPEQEATSFLEGLKERFSQPVPATFVAGELDTFLDLTKLGFLQGDLETAKAKLRRGGYVLLPPESARTYGLNLGDRVTLSVGQHSAEFEVAGVVESPALDIAVTFFQADSYMMLASAGSFLGTLEDAHRCFNVDSVTMFLMNLDIPSTRPPDEFKADTLLNLDDRALAVAILSWRKGLPNERDTLEWLAPKLESFASDQPPPSEPGRVGPVRARLDPATRRELKRYRLALQDTLKQWDENDPQRRWEQFCERLVLRRVAQVMDRSSVQIGSLRTLKENIDREIREATLLASAIPAVALMVAALGVANLMMVNVTTRSRQIAVVRAVGATKGQIIRLVLSEALTLGLLGSVVGVLLGLHSAASMNHLTGALIGINPVYTVPWTRVAVGVGLTVLICLAAGIAPARHAARNNIVNAIASL